MNNSSGCRIAVGPCEMWLWCALWSILVAEALRVGTERCDQDRLAIYTLRLETHWNRDLFPKQFPEWRPSAQWSRLIGRSHDRSFSLFRIGDTASDGFKTFCETGQSDGLDAQSQGEGGVFDEFNGPAISSGQGTSLTEFFVDGNHTQVSIAVRIVPSPDWFVGLDSLQLCKNGFWIDALSVQTGPMDAGTDSGFTFTAPNWPSEPRQKISHITAQQPSHPANSFYYPEKKRLPPVATFHFHKVRSSDYAVSDYNSNELTIVNTFHERHGNSTVEGGDLHMVQSEPTSERELGHGNSTVEGGDLHMVQSEPTSERELGHGNSTVEGGDLHMVQSEPTSERELGHGNSTVEGERVLLQDDVSNDVLPSIVDDQTQRSKSKKHRRTRKGTRMYTTYLMLMSRAVSCQVGEWGPWSPCSLSCGIGESTRSRKVLKHSRRGGRPCPPLAESKWCGEHTACPQRFFNW
ncbi:hypothetical protein B7P43_G05541 [Cryptotermes secundus]|uniref:Spondin domain-containing protein n=1 Tax=Cryptotermes secundus TaxID=105785 RepID=A0A2J7PXN3_9NEOP|nr:hypothetical protein B7P43_G05541 [Cryptotermes secundus]